MSKKSLGVRAWDQLLEALTNKAIPTEEIGSAIVKLGKPFNKNRILTAKDIVAQYLHHEDSWVRHEAMWFLTSWGKLVEYQPSLIFALKNDPDLDNRSYAASSLGILQRGSSNQQAIAALKESLNDDRQDELVRKYAYRSLLQIARNDSGSGFSPHDKKLSDIDWRWINSL
jgi:HEAT repeat protein